MVNKTEHKDTILLQIVVDKFPGEFCVAVAVTVKLIHEAEVLMDVTMAVGMARESDNPGYETAAGYKGNKHHPEPNEKIYLLIKQIDWKHTLDGVALDIPQAAHLKIAHGNPGEHGWLSPINSIWDCPQDINTIHFEVEANESIEDENLTDDISDVEELTEDVDDDKIMTKPPTTHRFSISAVSTLARQISMNK